MPITCDAPTPHYPSGRALLEHYDTDNDGKLTSSDHSRAFTDMVEMAITEAEYNFVDSLFAFAGSDPRYGDINSKCPLLGTYTFNLIQGDSYISLPFLPAVAIPAAVFGIEVSLWGYDRETATWIRPSELVCEGGYYLYAPKAKSVTVTGAECVVTVADLIVIYNSLSVGQYALVGVGNADINVTGTVLDGKVQGYNPDTKEFEDVNILKRGEGYWIGEEAQVTITFLTHKENGDELKGVSVYINEIKKGET